jgi:hypothetical protein
MTRGAVAHWLYAPGIDTRSGTNGYVIAGGFVLPDGTFYERVEGTPDVCEAYAAGAIPVLPDWVIAALDRRQEVETETLRAPVVVEISAGRGREWSLAKLTELERELARAPEGQRNHTLNAVAYALARCAARGWLTYDEIWAACERGCKANGYLHSRGSNDGPRNFRRSFNSGYKDGLLNPSPGPRERNEEIDPEWNRYCDEMAVEWAKKRVSA